MYVDSAAGPEISRSAVMKSEGASCRLSSPLVVAFEAFEAFELEVG